MIVPMAIPRKLYKIVRMTCTRRIIWYAQERTDWQ